MNIFGINLVTYELNNIVGGNNHLITFYVDKDNDKRFAATRLTNDWKFGLECPFYWGHNKGCTFYVATKKNIGRITMTMEELMLVHAHLCDRAYNRVEVLENKCDEILANVAENIAGWMDWEIEEKEIEEYIIDMIKNGTATPLEYGTVNECLEYIVEKADLF